jgi:hypothetical protein
MEMMKAKAASASSFPRFTSISCGEGEGLRLALRRELLVVDLLSLNLVWRVGAAAAIVVVVANVVVVGAMVVVVIATGSVVIVITVALTIWTLCRDAELFHFVVEGSRGDAKLTGSLESTHSGFDGVNRLNDIRSGVLLVPFPFWLLGWSVTSQTWIKMSIIWRN